MDAGPHIEHQAIKILCFTIVYWLSLDFNRRFPDIFVTMAKIISTILVGNSTKAEEVGRVCVSHKPYIENHIH